MNFKFLSFLLTVKSCTVLCSFIGEQISSTGNVDTSNSNVFNANEKSRIHRESPGESAAAGSIKNLVSTFLNTIESQYSEECAKVVRAEWQYATDLSPKNEEALAEAETAFLMYRSRVQSDIAQLVQIHEAINDKNLIREVKFIAHTGPNKMEKQSLMGMIELRNNMKLSFGEAKVCDMFKKKQCDIRLSPGLDEILKDKNRTFSELEYYWTAWHDAVGKAIHPGQYKRYIGFTKDWAKANGFRDMSELTLSAYDDGFEYWSPRRFKNDMHDLWLKIQPHYRTLHAYVRSKMRWYYGEYLKKETRIPFHLVGNMWGQEWTHLYDITRPFKSLELWDVSDAMKATNYTPLKMAKDAENFFVGLGFSPLPKSFWENSIFEKPKDKKIMCHPSSYDFCSGNPEGDYRIKMCASVNMRDFIDMHREMSHIYYYRSYSGHHYAYRRGANPAFLEAVANAVALSVGTRKYFQCTVKLPMELDVDCSGGKITPGITVTDPLRILSELELKLKQSGINFLHFKLLKIWPLLPFAIALETWRWEVMEEKIPMNMYNKRWWELRTSLQGLYSTKERPDESFDAGAKYHIVADVPYIQHFISHILQFQIFQSLCVAAGEYTPGSKSAKYLHECDFSGNKAAGKKLREMMELGSSKPWPVILEQLTGSDKLDIQPMLNYFDPWFEQAKIDILDLGKQVCFGPDCRVKENLYKRVTLFDKKK